ncbi:hypothetical protein VMCG_07097 [Cytospora schulzeri]|uniref:Uncharacterized protein n=1 Tax=Cytospora schulzeri TaxID=448051 RepID=A0A423W514_9PEZI|nr:hypothetical protein VMCG_07097 [Valsa malicola]
MPLYPQHRQHPSTHPREPQAPPPPPPIPRDETNHPFPLPDPPRSSAQELLRRKQRRRRHLHLTPRTRGDILHLRDTYLYYREVHACEREEEEYREILGRQRRRGRRQRELLQQQEQQQQQQHQQQGQGKGKGQKGQGNQQKEEEDRTPGRCSNTPPPPPPPCLQCAVKGMHCSATQARHQDDEVRCQRCERNGEEFCVRQRGAGFLLLSAANRNRNRGGNRVPDPAWLREVKVKRGLALDLALRGDDDDDDDPGDRRRLLGIAADLLHHGGATFVHGTEVSPVHARNFALPMWHENDKPENERSPVYDMRMPAAYFKEVKARREEKRVELEMWMSKKRAEEAQKAEKRRIEDAQNAEKKRIDEEREKVRKFYRDQGSEKDKARRRAELRGVIEEQMALGKHPLKDIKPYVDGLTDKWIEEIKLGLRTELPF